MSRWAAIPLGLVAIVATVSLGACANTPAVSPMPTEQTATPNPSPTTNAVPDDVVGSFRAIADASCEKAYAEGVTESAVNGDARLILVPKDQGYQDFSAVSMGASGVGDLIWSTEEFFACNASIGFSFADESNSEYGEIEFDQSDGSYTVSVGEGNDVYIAEYTVSDGLIRTGASISAGESFDFEVEYGMPSEADIQILRDTVDAFLADDE